MTEPTGPDLTGPEGPPAPSTHEVDPARDAPGGAEAESGAPIGFTADVGGPPGFVDDPDEAREELVVAPDRDVDESRLEHGTDDDG